VSPLRGEKPQNWPLSKLNTGRFALRAMLPVMSNDNAVYIVDDCIVTYMYANQSSLGNYLIALIL